MRLSAAIPTIGATPLLFDLLDVLHADEIPTAVYDNGCPAPIRARLDEAPCVVIDATGMPLYGMWDRAVADAVSEHVAILNDDITVLPGTCAAMADALDTDPTLDLVSADYRTATTAGLHPAGVELTTGTYRHGGICGWCFTVRRSTYPMVGDGYTWWCGDDELVARIHAAGRRTGIARGVPVDHAGEASARTRVWTHNAKIADLATYAARWS